jgi:hypothetical protein
MEQPLSAGKVSATLPVSEQETRLYPTNSLQSDQPEEHSTCPPSTKRLAPLRCCG